MDGMKLSGLLYLRNVDEINAALIKMLRVYQSGGGTLTAQNRAALQGVLETLKWVLHQEAPGSFIARLLAGDRVDPNVVPQIKPKG